MTKWQREMFRRLMRATNDLGGMLDYTATNQRKLIDRQKAHGAVSTAIYHIFGDYKENDYRKDDMKNAEKLIIELEELSKVEYGDRYGINDFINPKD